MRRLFCQRSFLFFDSDAHHPFFHGAMLNRLAVNVIAAATVAQAVVKFASSTKSVMRRQEMRFTLRLINQVASTSSA